MNRDGSANVSYLLWSLGRDQGPDSETLFQVARDYSRSLDALEAVAQALSGLIAAG
jgi:hypothetical protein